MPSGLRLFPPSVSILGLISCTRLDIGQDVQSLKSDWSVLHAGLKAWVLSPLQGKLKDIKPTHTNTHTSNN